MPLYSDTELDTNSIDLTSLKEAETSRKEIETFSSLRLSTNCDPVAREAILILVDGIQTINEQLQQMVKAQQQSMLQISETLSEMVGRIKNILQ